MNIRNSIVLQGFHYTLASYLPDVNKRKNPRKYFIYFTRIFRKKQCACLWKIINNYSFLINKILANKE